MMTLRLGSILKFRMLHVFVVVKIWYLSFVFSKVAISSISEIILVSGILTHD